MMFNQGFVLAIKNDSGEILRESKEKTVYLPFYSNYQIYLKNNNNQRAAVSINVDGTNILGGQKIIVEPFSSSTLDRFCLDGNLSRGNKLQFVPLSDSRVQDPSSSQNGIITAKFWLECLSVIKVEPPLQYDFSPWYRGEHLSTDNSSSSIPNTTDHSYYSSVTPRSLKSLTPGQAEYCCSIGATVEGERSNQSFTSTSVNELKYITEITLFLRSSETPITIQDTKKIFCSNCGKKNKFGANFCSNCGNKL